MAYSTINEQEGTHRIFHILNKNITKEYRYTREEIKRTFTKKDHNLATTREKIIYSRFFKECDEEDLINLKKIFNVSKRNIKLIYKDLPERAFPGISKVWDKLFKLPNKKKNISHISKKSQPIYFTQNFLIKASSHV